VNRLQGKTALVTGASKGIGRATIEALAREGAAVVINFQTSDRAATEIAAAIETTGGKAWTVQADVSQPREIVRLFDEAEQLAGSLDIVVTNAGTYWQGALVDVTEAQFDEMFGLNAKGTFFALQQAARRVADGGRIINISTGATALFSPGIGLYCASKAPGEQITRTLSRELGRRRITVNSVSPGLTDTEMLPDDPEFVAIASGMSPFGRLGQPQEIADAVVFLASPEAGWITGQNLQVGGGII